MRIAIKDVKCPIHGIDMIKHSYQLVRVKHPISGILGMRLRVTYSSKCCDSEFRYEEFFPIKEIEGIDIDIPTNFIFVEENL